MTVELMTRLIEAVEGLAIVAGIFTGFYLTFSILNLIIRRK